MLNVIMLNVIMLIVIMLSVIMLVVIMLIAIMLVVIMLSVTAPSYGSFIRTLPKMTNKLECSSVTTIYYLV
jgi:uncharacterized membrane protein YqhA